MIFLTRFDRDFKISASVEVDCDNPPCVTRGISSVRGQMGLFVLRDVAQLVARTAGGREAAGSSPVIPTIICYNILRAVH